MFYNFYLKTKKQNKNKKREKKYTICDATLVYVTNFQVVITTFSKKKKKKVIKIIVKDGIFTFLH